MIANNNGVGESGVGAPSSDSSAPAVDPGSGYSSSMSSSWIDLLTGQRDYNNDWNSAEAEKQRKWQEKMAKNAVQYRVADMMKAGLNPVLAVTNGQMAAATPSGAQAKADTTLSSGLVSLMGAMISAQSAMQIANLQMQNQRWLQENNPNTIYGLVNRIIGDIDGSSGSKVSGKLQDWISEFKRYYGNGFSGYKKAFSEDWKKFTNK